MFPLVSLTTSYSWQYEREATSKRLVGWPQWRCQLLTRPRNGGITCAEKSNTVVHVAESSLRIGVKLKDVPPDTDSLQQV
jgi:hypothetical protein